MKRISLSVPVGEWSEHLEYAFRSLRPHLDHLKVVLLDASEDERTSALADKYSDIFEHRVHEKDAGQSAAINEGWALTDSEFIGWLNADDCLAPDSIERVLETFDATHADIVYGQSLILNSKRAPLGLHPAIRPDEQELERSCTISQPSCFVRRNIAAEIGYLDAGFEYAMDWDFWIRLKKSGAKFIYLNETLSSVIWEQGTKSSSFRLARQQELFKIVRREEGVVSALKTLSSFYGNHVVNYGHAGLMRNIIRSVLPHFSHLSRPLLYQSSPELAMKVFHFSSGPHCDLRLHVSVMQGIDIGKNIEKEISIGKAFVPGVIYDLSNHFKYGQVIVESSWID